MFQKKPIEATKPMSLPAKVPKDKLRQALIQKMKGGC